MRKSHSWDKEDKEDQSKYCISHPKLPVLDMKWENCDINVFTMVKHSKVSSSNKWRLQENAALRLMKCLAPSVSFDIFTDNYFTPFRLLTHLGVNNIWATRVLNKNRLRRCTFIVEKQLQIKERGRLEQHTPCKKAV